MSSSMNNGADRKLTKSTSLPVSLNKNDGKKKNNELKAGDDNVTVCVRIRPPNPKEIEAKMKSCFNPSVLCSVCCLFVDLFCRMMGTLWSSITMI
jgi:hypothetical protein